MLFSSKPWAFSPRPGSKKQEQLIRDSSAWSRGLSHFMREYTIWDLSVSRHKQSPPTQKSWPDRALSDAESPFSFCACCSFNLGLVDPGSELKRESFILDSSRQPASFVCSYVLADLGQACFSARSLVVTCPRRCTLRVHGEADLLSLTSRGQFSYRRTVFSLALLLSGQSILN